MATNGAAPKADSLGMGGGESGKGDVYAYRSLNWRLQLGACDEGVDCETFVQTVREQRARYNELRKKHTIRTDAELADVKRELDENPLSGGAKGTEWHAYMNTYIPLLTMLRKDINRTFSELPYFHDPSTRKMLERILLVWSMEQEDCFEIDGETESAYRQGMHELLAIIAMVLFKDLYRHENEVMKKETAEDKKERAQQLSSRKLHSLVTKRRNKRHNVVWMSPDERDAARAQELDRFERQRSKFQERRKRMSDAGDQNSNTTNTTTSAADADNEDSSSLFPPLRKARYIYGTNLAEDRKQVAREVIVKEYLEHDAYTLFEALINSTLPFYTGAAAVQGIPYSLQPFLYQRVQYIHHTLLRRFDPELYVHLERAMVLPQLYLIRWLRVLFTREFTLKQAIMLWDSLFLQKGMQLVDYLAVAMLSYIRHDLLSLDATLCLMKVFHYPSLDDKQVRELLDLAVEMWQKVEGKKKKTKAMGMTFTPITIDTEKLARQFESFVGSAKQKLELMKSYYRTMVREVQSRRKQAEPEVMEEMMPWEMAWSKKANDQEEEDDDEDEFGANAVSVSTRDMSSEWDNIRDIDDLMAAVPWNPALIEKEEEQKRKREQEEKRAAAARAAKKRAAIARARKAKAAAKAKAARMRQEAAARAKREKEEAEAEAAFLRSQQSAEGGDVGELDDDDDQGWDDL